MIHYFNGEGQMAYTLCWELPFGPMAVRHTVEHEEVTCPTCLKIMGVYYIMMKREIDLVAPAVGSPFRSTVVWNSKPLKHPFVRPVALYRSEDHDLLGYQIGVFDRAVPPAVPWRGLQGVMPVLVPSLEDWEAAVKEHLGEYIADG